MRILSCILATAMVGCGGTPPAQQPVSAPTYSTLAPTLKAQVLPKPHKSYVVLASKGLPEGEALENIFARKSAMAEVGPTPGGIEVSLEGVLCTVRKAAAPTDIPKHILPTETEPHGLSTDEAKALGATNRFYAVRCVPDRELPLRGLPQFAEKVVEGVADATDGWIHDVHTGRYWPKAAWTSARKASERYSTHRVIRVLKVNEGDGRYLLATRGMAAFGRPDLLAFPLTVEQAEAFEDQLRTMADLLIDESAVGSGLRLSLGPVNVLLLKRGLFANSLGGALPVIDDRGHGKTALELAIVDPNGAQGVLSGQATLFRKLLIR